MSQSISRSRQGNRGRMRVLSKDVLEWKASVLQRLGWESKTAQQQTTFNELDLISQALQQRVLRGQGEYGADATRSLGKGSGKEFSLYHKLLTAFEKSDERKPELIAELKAAAQAYLDHYAKHGKMQKNDPKNIAKKEACEATIRDLRSLEIAVAVQALGQPPWDTEQSMQAASLKTAFDIMSLPPGEQRVERLEGGDNKSPAFWINQRESGQTKKTFIFKPGSLLPTGARFPPGGEPGREALSGRVAEVLNGALGLNLPMPETQVVQLGRETLPPQALQELTRDGTLSDSPSYVGSVQKFERVQGSMRELSLEDLKKIPTRATQELALFDTIVLNTDRHPGNFLFRPGENGTPQLVPIDHGLCLPPPESTLDLTMNFGSNHNALLQLPGSHEPFSEDMQKIIEQLDPDAMKEMLKRERSTIENVHESTKNTISDGAIECSRRSAMFLKRAARQLTPAAVQVAIARFHVELFDPDLDLNAFDELADSIIREMQDQQEGLKEYFTMPPDLQAKMKSDLEENGWTSGGRMGYTDAVQYNPALALRLWKANIKSPQPDTTPDGRPLELDNRAERDLQDAKGAFPKMSIPSDEDGQRAMVKAWREWKEMGATRDSLRTALNMAGATKANTEKALQDVVTAVAYLKRAKAVTQLLESDTSDPQIQDIRTNIAYLDNVRPALSQGKRNELDAVLQRAKQIIEADPPLNVEANSRILAELVEVRSPVLDEARSRLLRKLDILGERSTDPRVKKHAKDLKGEVESYAILKGYEEIQKIDPTLADAE